MKRGERGRRTQLTRANTELRKRLITKGKPRLVTRHERGEIELRDLRYDF